MAWLVPLGKGKGGRNRYKVRWHGPNGKVSSKTIAGFDEAHAFKNLVEDSLRSDEPVPGRRPRRTFEQIAIEWQGATALRGKVSSSTTRDSAILRLHILPVIGDRPIGSIDEDDIQVLVNAWRDRYESTTVRRHHAVLSAVFGYAVRKKYVDTSPCLGDVRLPTVVPVARPILDGSTLERLAQELGGRMAPFMWLGAESGLRWGEAAGLTKDRVDVDNRVITVDRQLNRDNRLAPLKNKQRRTIAIGARLAEDLNRLAFHRSSLSSSDHLIFTDSRGGCLRYSNWRRRAWFPACRRADVPGLRFHDLRSLNATMLVALKVDPKTAQVRQGHTHISTTLDIYRALSPAADRIAADALEDHLRSHVEASSERAG